MSRDKETPKNYNHLFVAAGVMLCFFLVFIGLLIGYLYKFDQQLTLENKTQLSEVSSYIANHMTTVVNDKQDSLITAANALVLLDSEEKRMDYLDKIAEQYSFAYIGYANADGILHATVETESVDVSKEPFFHSAIRGENFVSDQIRKIFTSQAMSGILLAVPMWEGELPGVLVAMLETKNLRSALSLENFGGEGYSYIIDKNGTLVMRTKSLDVGNLFTAWENLQFDKTYSIESFIDNVKNDCDGLVVFDNMVGATQYAYYRPLPFNNWVVINIVSEKAISEKTIALTQELGAIGAFFVFIFMSLMFWAMHSYQVSQESKSAAAATSAFLANMSHEIRTPMNAIVGLSEIMLRDESHPKHRDQLTSILNSGKGLLTVINDILDISKIESGKFTIIDDKYELESLLYDLTIITAIRIGEKPIAFLVDLDPDLPCFLIGDMGRVKQVLLNIIGNAIKFTDKGFIKLIVKAKQENTHWKLHMEVQDTGIGIKPEDLSKMFVRFAQVDTKRNRNIEGTGLGLTISQKLCEMMNGHIEISSEYGQGSVFTISIQQGIADSTLMTCKIENEVSLLLYEPSKIIRDYEAACMEKLEIQYKLAETAESFEEELRYNNYTHILAPLSTLKHLDKELLHKNNAIALLSLREHSLIDTDNTHLYVPLFPAQLPYILNGTESFRTLKNSRVDMDVIDPMPYVSILLVDDNELNILVAEGLMAPYEMQIDHVYSGKEAIRAIQDKDYDMVLLDHMMPEMDGVEAIKIMRSLPDGKYKKLPIIALTANTTSEARQMFLHEGFDEFLAKPIETHKLNTILKDWLKDINTERESQYTSGKLILPPKKIINTPTAAASLIQEAAPEADAEVDFFKGQEFMPSREFYLKILAAYIHSTGDKLNALPNWLERDEKRAIIEIHGLKSASTSIGAMQFSEVSKQLELLGKEGHIDQLKLALPAYIKKGQKTLSEIETYLEKEEKI